MLVCLIGDVLSSVFSVTQPTLGPLATANDAVQDCLVTQIHIWGRHWCNDLGIHSKLDTLGGPTPITINMKKNQQVENSNGEQI